MAHLTPELEANYRQLAGERDWSLTQMGDYVEGMEPNLAAELRTLDAESKPAKRAAAPKSRRSKPSETA